MNNDNFGILEDEWYHETGKMPTVDEAAAILCDLPRNASRALKLLIVQMAGVECIDFRPKRIRKERKLDWRREGF